MVVKEYLKDTFKLVNGTFLDIRKGVECEDGFTMSIQASKYHYCTPRRDISSGDYESIEIGFPSEKEDLLMPYAECEEEPTGTVYGYVPIETVEEVIKKHGGIKSIK